MRHFSDARVFIECLNDIEYINAITDEYNTNKKVKILIVFDDKIVDMSGNKKLQLIITKLLIRGRKLSISLIFTTKS